MSSWATKKRNRILAVIFLVIFVPTAIIGFLVFYEKPNCFDNKKNGKETGVDCGGTCDLLCSNATIDPIVHWKRYFKVSEGVYNVVAYVENQNIDAGASNIPYTFTLYDRDNVPLSERTGYADLRPREVIPIIENNMDTGRLEPVRVAFKFNNQVVWTKENPIQKVLVVRDEILEDNDGFPRISATIQNTSIKPVLDIKIAALLYDNEDNAIGSSNTVIKRMEGESSQRIIFTWPIHFDDSLSRFEIIPIYEFHD